MARRHRGPTPASQSGQAFLVTLLLVVFGVAALIYNFVTPAKATIADDRQTAAALAQAKEALIGYAAAQPSGGSYRPGELPCPDTNNDGSEEPTCNTVASRIGRLPWKTLGLPDPRDGSGERLWYAVSNVYKNATQTGILNSDTPGDYTVTGTTPASNVIAVVFAPGAVIGSQVRDTANENNVANYLEGDNANLDTTFTTALPSNTFNDKLLLITSDVLFPAVTMRVAREARTFLLAYYSANGYFPNANPLADSSYYCNSGTYQGRIPVTIQAGPAGCTTQVNWSGGSVAPPWFFANNWHQVVFYAVSNWCTDISVWWYSLVCSFFGGLNLPGLSPNTQALVIATGRGLSGQVNRPCAGTPCTAADLMEDAENTNGDSVFVSPVLSATDNDRLVVVSP